MADEKQFPEDMDIVTLEDEDGKESEFEIIGKLTVEGTDYFALIPLDEGSDGDEYVILKKDTDENGEEMYVTIDDDDEFDKIADMFDDELMTENEYDYDASEEDEEDK